MRHPTSARSFALALVAIAASACGREQDSAADVGPFHLEQMLDSVLVEGAEVPGDVTQPLRFDLVADGAAWKALPTWVEGATPAEVSVGEGGLTIRLGASTLPPERDFLQHYGGIYLELDDFDINAWSHVVIEGRSTAPGAHIGLSYNVREAPGEGAQGRWPTLNWGSDERVDSDGEVHSYRMPTRSEDGFADAVRQLSINFGTREPGEFELRSVTLIPAITSFAEAGYGVRSVSSSAHEDFGPQRWTLWAHAPSRLTYRVPVPEGGRLDLALGAFAAETRLAVRVEHGDASEVLLRETVAPAEAWRQRSVDLSRWAGRDVRLTLEAERAGDAPSVAFWASPTLSGTPVASAARKRPNVVFYVIDGASAGFMSVYGYERPTTPNLERIAAQGVVFENAHSNSTWTMASTASFMTSLHHSVLGGLRNDANPVPPNVRTMAEHFHRAGFHTGVFTFNPNAGAKAGLDRGVDVFRDFGERGAPLDPIEAISSVVLHEQYWQWREAYPGPYWVHFQTTDVHPPHHPQDPWAGRFVPKERSEAVAARMGTLRFPFRHTSASVHEHWQGQLAQHGIDAQEFYGTMRDAHDEAMLHQDARLGELVEELKARGEWQDTLLVIASDHGHPAASYPRFGRGLLDPQPEPYEGALFGEYESHVPLIFVWPGGIEGGRRIAEPVSMIDVLPTLLELADLPRAQVAQGQSLAPLLLGREGWTPRPVVFDEFRATADGALVGNLEIVDGRWGRSLEIRTADAEPVPDLGRHPAPAGGRWAALPFAEVPRLLIYDLEADPLAVDHVAEPDAELLRESQARLWKLWEEHRALAATFEAGQEAELSPQQLEALKALGYAE